ncbi:helix-turn-helix transcriptional regulator [Aquimonas voraii]|uniref:Transcriptional regulator, AlpA family n=1 Tax=Aquimonas voraii TaxID=265719 RepID=A0A1G6TUI3_9GAMM|nr:AlpA family phage regulatory protein [Aquimonas voraii]SDD32753.1 transcriptional regulator, AlpA family [Aquimonas voraii]
MQDHTDVQFLPIRAVVRRLGVCRSTVYRWIEDNGFPKPVSIGPNCARWVAAEVDAWAAGRIAASRSAPRAA